MSVKEFIRKGFSLDIFFLFFLGCFVAFFKGKKIFSIVNVTLGVYFCDERMGLLVDFFSISAGIYITMLSILAISTTKIMEALLKKRMEQQLLDVMMWGLISNVIVILALVFIPEMRGKNIILLATLIWAFLRLIYFFFVLFAIFKFNVQNMDKEIDEENTRRAFGATIRCIPKRSPPLAKIMSTTKRILRALSICMVFRLLSVRKQSRTGKRNKRLTAICAWV